MNVNIEKFQKLLESLYGDENGISEESHGLVLELLEEAQMRSDTRISATDGRFYSTCDSDDLAVSED